MNTRTIAEKLGWNYSERTSYMSRFPIIDPPGANGLYVFVEPVPGRVVAVANVHLPSDPYGPYEARDGATRAQYPALLRILQWLDVLPEAMPQVFIVSGGALMSHLFKKIRTSLVRTVTGRCNEIIPEV